LHEGVWSTPPVQVTNAITADVDLINNRDGKSNPAIHDPGEFFGKHLIQSLIL